MILDPKNISSRVILDDFGSTTPRDLQVFPLILIQTTINLISVLSNLIQVPSNLIPVQPDLVPASVDLIHNIFTSLFVFSRRVSLTLSITILIAYRFRFCLRQLIF